MLPNPSLLTLQDILSAPLPPVEWDCEPIIPHRRRVVLYGEFGALKSWVLLDLALHLASGTSWLGRYPVRPARPVLYLDEEMVEEDLRRRVQQLAAGMDPPPAPETPFRAYSRVGVTFDGQGAQRLLAHLTRAKFDPAVIIVEALVRVLVGNENLAHDLAAFWRAVEPLIRAGNTVIVSHHMVKPNPIVPLSLRSRARGSGDILAGADVGWAVEIVHEGHASQLSCVKTRSSALPRPFRIRLVDLPGEAVRLLPAVQQEIRHDDEGDQELKHVPASPLGSSGDGRSG